MINQNQFDEWLESPVTEIFLKYLKDSAKEEVDLVTDLIVGGGQVNEREQVRISTTCLILNQISEIDLNEINDFYKENE